MKLLNNENTQKKLNIIIFVAVAIAVLSVGIYGMSVMFKSNSKTPTGTVQLISNPSVMFVLNSSDRVIDVVYGNKDGETILADTDLTGKSIREACIMFAKLCARAGFIDVTNTSSGQKVEILVTNTSNKKVDSLRKTIVDALNGYFDENGIIAGAICNTMNDYKSQAEELGTNINKYLMVQTALALNSQYNQTELIEFSEKKLIKHIKVLMDNMKDLSYDNYIAYSDLINEKIIDLEKFVQEKLNPINDIVEDINFEYDLNLTINDLIMQVDQLELDVAKKEAIKNILNTINSDVNKKITDLNNQVKKEKENFVKNSEDDKAQAKLLLQSKITSYKTTYETSYQYYLENKVEIQEKINEYRALMLNESLDSNINF